MNGFRPLFGLLVLSCLLYILIRSMLLYCVPSVLKIFVHENWRNNNNDFKQYPAKVSRLLFQRFHTERKKLKDEKKTTNELNDLKKHFYISHNFLSRQFFILKLVPFIYNFVNKWIQFQNGKFSTAEYWFCISKRTQKNKFKTFLHTFL